MSAETEWQCFMNCPDEASAFAVAEYLPGTTFEGKV